MRIGATSRLLALLGDPVSHSLSPLMHNAAIRAAGLDAVFVALRVLPADLRTVVRALAAVGGAGSVTVPHKLAAALLVDRPAEAVRRTGACNTFWVDGDGALCGDNTDIAGIRFAAAALLAGADVRRALVIGTGGAARAAVTAIHEGWPRARIQMASRSDEAAAQFRSWAESTGVPVESERWSVGGRATGARGHGGTGARGHVGAGPRACPDLVVNATPLGLHEADELPIDPAALAESAPRSSRAPAVLDLPYRKGETPLVRRARDLGCKAADGRVVLVEQGRLAFRSFFAREPSVEIMRWAVEDALRP